MQTSTEVDSLDKRALRGWQRTRLEELSDGQHMPASRRLSDLSCQYNKRVLFSFGPMSLNKSILASLVHRI